jgi:uncharacterized protein (DUF433 family)
MTTAERGRCQMAWYDQHITRIPGVQGGVPVLRGTRTPIRSVVVLYWRTYPQAIDQVQEALPHLTRTQIEAALAFYCDHRAEVDADIESQQQALRRFVATS